MPSGGGQVNSPSDTGDKREGVRGRLAGRDGPDNHLIGPGRR